MKVNDQTPASATTRRTQAERTAATRALPGVLDASTNGKKDTRILLRADKLVPYGEVMQVMNMLRTAGYLKVALVGMEQASPL